MTTKKIHKQVLDATNEAQWVPASEVLDIQFQGNQLCVWYVTAETPTEGINLMLAGTGWDRPADNYVHAATVQDGAFVWHVFRTRTKTEYLDRLGI